MNRVNDLFELILPFIPLMVATIFVILFLWIAHIVVIKRHQSIGNEKLFARQLVMLALTLAGIMVIVLSLPISDATRNQVITLIGLVISGIFAFSSSTIFANLMAGLMLRVTRPFKTGDFIEIDNLFGRVVERGLLDTEIQTEHKELIAFPNTYLITHPVTVIDSSGTIISTTLSLGYDVHHNIITRHLLEAAEQSKLEEPFAQILKLGDFSVTYKISGVLHDTKNLLTSRSNLNRCVLDCLHRQGIEIASPAFMNQRRIHEGVKFIPRKMAHTNQNNVSIAEDSVFDKASQAEQIEKEKEQLSGEIEALKLAIKESADSEDKKALQDKLAGMLEKMKQLQLTDANSSDALAEEKEPKPEPESKNKEAEK